MRLVGVVAAVGLTSCAYLQVDPESRSVDYRYSAPFLSAPFETAAVVVNGESFTIDRNTTGVALGNEKHYHRAIVDAFLEKAVFARLSKPDEVPDLQIMCDFRVEDDVNPLHRSVSMLTLYLFPFWKMVRASVIAEVRAEDHAFEPFWFEDEVQMYVSPVLLPGALFFKRPGAEQRLAEGAGRALALHVIRTLRRARDPVYCPPEDAPPGESGSAADRAAAAKPKNCEKRDPESAELEKPAKPTGEAR